MEKAGHEHVIGIPVSSTAIGIEEPEFTSDDAKYSTSARTGGKSGRRTGDKFARGIKEHVSLGPKLYETVRGKLSLGARILQAGGVEKVFRRCFSVEKGEKLLKASQCYLSTTAGPIAGMLFVSSERVAFRSDRSLALTSPKGDTVRVPYKVAVPLRRVKAVKPSENQHRPEQKYVQLVTDDGFEFWFMGFVTCGLPRRESYASARRRRSLSDLQHGQHRDLEDLSASATMRSETSPPGAQQGVRTGARPSQRRTRPWLSSWWPTRPPYT